MEKMLLNKITKVVSISGDVKVESYDEGAATYEEVMAEEINIGGFFKLIGKRVDGSDFECVLTQNEYFDGKPWKFA